MEKITRLEGGFKEFVVEILDKLDEIVDWINKREERERKWLEEINKGLHARR